MAGKYPVTLRLTKPEAVMVKDALEVVDPDEATCYERGARKVRDSALKEVEVALAGGQNRPIRKRAIVVTVKGGIVQDVDGIPEGTVIEVHDYDTDGGSSRDRKDKDGCWYHLGSWLKAE